MENKIDAVIIEHSSFNGNELISIETYAPKFLDAEIEKHRMISSNSSSDRAIPIERMIEADYFIPDDVRLNQSGMQGEEKAAKYEREELVNLFEGIREKSCQVMVDLKHIHKQHLNRLLLPFSYQKKIMTANKEQWDYFLSLRLHKAADPAIYQLAYKINDAIEKSFPVELESEDWHLPYIRNEERFEYSVENLCKMSSARCARTSYNNHDGTIAKLEDDLKLFGFLINEELPHATPTEHQAKPMVDIDLESDGISHMTSRGEMMSGNFSNFIQFRKILEDNNWRL